MPSTLWFLKHMPKRFTELIFSTDAHLQTLKWLSAAGKGSILHISGGYGTGKTCLIKAAAKALKYNVIELDDTSINNLKNFIKVPSVNINNLKNLLLIDESVIENTNIFINSIKNASVPIIITSKELFFKDIEAIKIESPHTSTVLQILKPILTKESLKANERSIIKIAEKCNFDIRLIINNIQFFHKKFDLCDSMIFDQKIFRNIFDTCKSLLSRRMALKELEDIYDYKTARLCLNSLIERSNNFKIIAASLESFSQAEFLPESYKFTVLKPLNQSNESFVYKKELPVEYSSTKAHQNPLWYLEFYRRSLANKKNILHLQNIFKKYKIEPTNEIDKEILNYVEIEYNEKRTLKYKYNKGSANAVRRNVGLWEVLN